jgi:hypothetical protein
MVSDAYRDTVLRLLVDMGFHAYTKEKIAGSHRTQVFPCITGGAEMTLAMDLSRNVPFDDMEQGYPRSE